MNNRKHQMLDILRLNKGFSSPERWLEYAITHDFKPTPAHKLHTCPDCSAGVSKTLGQFVYYSTLVKLQLCSKCGLVFSDTRIDSEIIQKHFERTYKDEGYFQHRRARIFRQIADLADKTTPRDGRVLDIGGAKGHLLFWLRQRRPDISYYLNDLSREACNHAAKKYNFKTVPGGVNDLEKINSRFDTVIMSDVLYYEPELHRLMALLPHLVAREGVLIIRLPNNFSLIRVWQIIQHTLLRFNSSELQDDIRFFNPEHLYVFSRRYLQTRLKKLEFEDIRVIPATLPGHNSINMLCKLYYTLSKILFMLSFGKIIITPGFIVIAKKASGSLVASPE